MVSMSAKEKILLAYENILIHQGEKAASLDAVAKAAQVSKGGLLYHFPSKEALATGLVERTLHLAEQDLAAMAAAPEGPVDYYLEGSIFKNTEFDRALLASSRLAQEANQLASAAMIRIQDGWQQLITSQIGDKNIARAIILMGDGSYYNAAFMRLADPALQQERDKKDRQILRQVTAILTAKKA